MSTMPAVSQGDILGEHSIVVVQGPETGTIPQHVRRDSRVLVIGSREVKRLEELEDTQIIIWCSQGMSHAMKMSIKVAIGKMADMYSPNLLRFEVGHVDTFFKRIDEALSGELTKPEPTPAPAPPRPISPTIAIMPTPTTATTELPLAPPPGYTPEPQREAPTLIKEEDDSEAQLQLEQVQPVEQPSAQPDVVEALPYQRTGHAKARVMRENFVKHGGNRKALFEIMKIEDPTLTSQQMAVMMWQTKQWLKGENPEAFTRLYPDEQLQQSPVRSREKSSGSPIALVPSTTALPPVQAPNGATISERLAWVEKTLALVTGVVSELVFEQQKAEGKHL